MEANKILSADYIDLLFENRNKNYGSYVLRKSYERRGFAALMTMIAMVLSLFFIVYFLNKNNREDNHDFIGKTKQPEVFINNIELPEKVTPPPVTKQHDNKPAASAPTQKFSTPEVTANQNVKPEDELKPLETNKLAGPFNNLGSENGIDIAKTPKDPVETGTGYERKIQPPKPEDKKIYSQLDRQPQYPGGFDALKAYLLKNLHYPQMAIDADIFGTVIVQFVVDEDGSITQAKVVKSIGASCDKEALRVINNMPKWAPGIVKGKNVKSYYKLPITFRLNN